MREPFKPRQEAHTTNGPISDETTHKHDYIPHPMERPTRHQAAEWVQPPGNIDFQSSYKTVLQHFQFVKFRNYILF